MNNSLTISKKTSRIAILLFAMVLCSVIAGPMNASAQTDAAGALAVPTHKTGDTAFTTIMDYLKKFTLDKLAYQAAKQLLHQMTASVVNWINGGFNGSPSFLTNPEGFFLDVADQTTGAFIAAGGPLSKLCSPFSTDIRLVLALQQSRNLYQRYTCTLGTIAGNVQGSGEAFMNNFSQGGWPAFVQLTTQPQNNFMGAYLQAQSDLAYLVGAKKSAIQQDLLHGRGFLSWEDCDDITVDDAVENAINAHQEEALYEMQDFNEYKGGVNSRINTLYGTSLSVSTKEDGSLRYQNCQNQTPGSVIQESLQKHLNVPATELELAQDINAIISALISQMTTQLISGGLRGLSGGGSGSNNNPYTKQLSDEAAKKIKADKNLPSSILNGSPVLGSLQESKETYDRAIALVTASKNRYETAKACFVNKASMGPIATGGQDKHALKQAEKITGVLATQVNPLLQGFAAQETAIENSIASVQNSTTGSGPSEYGNTDLQEQIQDYTGLAGAVSGTASENYAKQAEKDMETAEKQVKKFDKDAYEYQLTCDAIVVYNVQFQTNENP